MHDQFSVLISETIKWKHMGGSEIFYFLKTEFFFSDRNVEQSGNAMVEISVKFPNVK